MGDVNSTDTRYYPSKDLCERLGISSSTLRKWCIALEKQEYEFTRTEQDRRLYTDKDLPVLDALKELIQSKRMSLENASVIVASRFLDRSNSRTPSVREETGQNPNMDSAISQTLTEHIEKQEQFNQELLKRLDEQNQYINNRLDQRDKALTETMNQLMEQRKEEIKLLEEAKKEKVNWLSKLFKKRTD